MSSIPVNAFSAPHVRQVMQKQKLRERNKAKEDASSVPGASQINSARKSAPDTLENVQDLTKKQNFLDTFKNIIPTMGRRDLLDRSISCCEPRMEIQIEIKDFSYDDISTKSPGSSNDLSPTMLNVGEKKRFRFLSGQ